MSTNRKNRHLVNKLAVYCFLYLVTAWIIFSTFYIRPTNNNSIVAVRIVIIAFATILLTKYFIYMIISPFYDLWVMFQNIKFKHRINFYQPLVSVIIPAWNEEVGILSTVQSILDNDYHSIEIVIVNDGSTDNSDEIIKNFISSYENSNRHQNKTLVYKYKTNGGKGAALNTGIEMSKGDIIITIDADCVVSKNAISNFVKYFANPKVMAAVGNVKIGNTKSLLGTVQYLEFLFSFYFKKADSIMNTIYIIGGAAGAFRREIFDTIGGYNTKNITEDIELSVRIQAAGMKIVYAADAIVYTEGASDIKGLMKQRLRWKRGRFQTFKSHAYLFFNKNRKNGPNKLLTHIVLPLAIFGETQLFFELLFLMILYVYSYFSNDFSSFLSGIIVVSSMFVVQMFNDREKKNKPGFFLIAPIGWLLFYLSTIVEYNALIKSIWSAYKKSEVKWQSWQRNGVSET